MNTGNFEYPTATVLTTRMGAVNGLGNLLYLSAYNPAVVNGQSYQSYDDGDFFGAGCTNSGGTIDNAIAVSRTAITLDSIWSPPFHIQ